MKKGQKDRSHQDAGCLVITGLLLILFSMSVYAQTDDWCPPGSKVCFEPTLLTPGSHIFFDQKADIPGEFDVFKDGKLSLDLQLFGADIYWEDSPPPPRIEKPRIRWGCIFSSIIYLLTFGYVVWLGVLIFYRWNWPG